jgi:ADP-ribose pyrophosphatase YjhB (NUDIX family)
MRILFGDRIGRKGKIRLGCSVVILDETKEKVLLTRRADNGQWCLPSGGMEPGESLIETCERETLEETGLMISIERLTSIYSNPDRLVIYSDGNQFQIVTMNFKARWVGGSPRKSNETTEIGFFSIPEIENMDIFPHHRQFISDAISDQPDVYIR